ncbi:urea amidolyase family protein [Brevibacterium paucivorans]|uniref:5-oxoprolinase subunit B/C family protein n=1 Tax=Brevibacterium paucivorans TaxID=170994 RepID=UPI0031DA5575
MTPEFRLMGTRSVLIDLPDTQTVMRWHAHLNAHPLDGQIEVIAAANTLLFKADTRRALDAAFNTLRTLQPPEVQADENKTADIDVVYSGEDLEEAANMYGMSPQALIDYHTSEEWTAAFGGFAPGFVYCTSASQSWDTPRKSSPRPQVPAGSVALAGPYSAVYPIDSPGGWQLIGTTPTPVWDETQNPPNLIHPGDTVRYRAVTEHIDVKAGTTSANSSGHSPHPGEPVATVTEVGLQALFQDLGRVGHGDVGVSTSGALDRGAARQANRIVGNSSSATVIECLFGGFSFCADVDVTCAVTGAQAPLKIDGQPAPLRTPVVVPAGAKLSVGAPTCGARNYVAVRGGFATPTVMGSSASDTLSKLGPDPIVAGQALSVRTGAVPAAVGESEPSTLPENLESVTLRAVPGPRAHWCAPGELDTLASQTWTVSSTSNRIALRLAPSEDGRVLRRAEGKGELASEGMVSGAIQVPPEGQPVLFLADHPVTGGYPVIATVVAEDLDLAAQLPPGTHVHFDLVDVPGDAT